MPPRPPLFEFGKRNFVCNSCLSALRKRPTATPWPNRQLSSQSTNSHALPRTKRRSPEQEAERLKTLKSLGLIKDDSSKVAVNYFEQGESGRIRRLRDEDEFSKELIDPGGELDARLKQLEDQLQGVTSLAKAIEEMGGKEEADKLRRQFAHGADGNGDDMVEETDSPSLSSLAIPIGGLQGHRQDRIHRLNNWIRRCVRLKGKNAVTSRDILGLWKTYSAARTIMSGRWQDVPAMTWEVLWETLSAEYTFKTNRMSHVYALAKDMQQAGTPLRPDQQILALEAMFVDGWETEAIKNHRRHASTLGKDPETFMSFWQLGLQMYCRIGDLERAERIASTIFESPYKKDPRFILPLIKLYVETPATVGNGFKRYRDLRASLGDSMTIEDYDTITSYFLASGNTEYALYVFVDMMKSGSVDLLGVQEYPPSIANPFFFGKWLKRLIGAGDLEGAFNVLRFMRSQGITPRAIQVNGLIGAWLRSGAADDAQKAEDVAWDMINTRLQYVEMRRRKELSGMNLYVSGDAWPRANLETFSLLAENYKERGLTAKIGPLWQSFHQAEIAPNSFMLNQLLLSLLQDGKGEALLPMYQEVVERVNLKPDSHTFMALWQALPVNRFTRIPSGDLDAEISSTRALFAEMMKRRSSLKSNDDLEMYTFLARNILHSFRKLRDKAGLLLAYRALRRIFNYNPTDMVVFEMLLGTLDLQRLTKRREGSKLIAAKMSLDNYLAHRHRELVKSGDAKDGEDMPARIRTEETGNFLELQLEAAFTDMEESDAQQLVIQAAEEMGLPTRAPEEAESHHDP
ncbi:hypothetical protein F5B22DRAFT_621149 [Xylaria bambusicola]|uniref:uncharacterized protein n=1 Tax=Xylaria bambusicola TaxID=326684 RepID=UPI00200773A3|nr:uncharacterized protein F5B22DRAFT_621149 [Xylaria bambusicola]KAI0508384.1 hypothetical protein F5B22DRAFT_621149 [Xylaria bambusicola]